MAVQKVLIFGDSNTYGYDPREFSGGRYPAKMRWSTILKDRLKETHELIIDGMNGRPLPSIGGQHPHLRRLLQEHQPIDLFICMLGTNDILLTTEPDAQVPIEKMDHFLYWLDEEAHLKHIIIIAPTYIGNGVDRYYDEYHRQSILMNEGYKKLTLRHHVGFADASTWNIKLAYDQVHFAPEGCLTFADHMERLLTEYNPG